MKTNEVIWTRTGDEDDYHPFNDVEEVAQYLFDFYGIEKIERLNDYGVTSAPDFEGNNYISLFWGGDKGREPSRALTAEEIIEINESLESCRDCPS